MRREWYSDAVRTHLRLLQRGSHAETFTAAASAQHAAALAPTLISPAVSTTRAPADASSNRLPARFLCRQELSILPRVAW